MNQKTVRMRAGAGKQKKLAKGVPPTPPLAATERKQLKPQKR